MIFAFEGIDGSGKSTVLKAVASVLLERHKIDPIMRVEPSHLGTGAEVRRLIQSGEIQNVPVDHVLQLLSQDRRGSLAQIGEMIEGEFVTDHQIVLTDRCYLSTLAYQTAQYPDDADRILESQREFFTYPVRHYWLKIDPVKAVARCAVRATDDDRSWDKDLKFIGAVHEQYGKLFMSREYRIMTVDATRPVNEIAEVIAFDVLHEIGFSG